MEQKKIWTNCLIFIINILISTLFLISCKNSTVDWVVRADWFFINQTAHSISFSKNYEKFNMAPYDTVFYQERGDGPEFLEAYSYQSPLYEAIVFYDSIRCDTIFNNGPGNIANFEYSKLEERYFEFTYTFTEEDFNNSTPSEKCLF